MMNTGKARARLLATTIIVSTFGAVPALAQTQNDASSANCPPGSTTPCGPAPSEIIVTGSRLASPTLTAATPLQVIDAKTIQATGASNIQDVLDQNPTVSTPTLSRTNSNFLTSSVGVATVDLRNLGTARTLVLVNGVRFVSGVPTDTAVDLNSIPTGFIDHVDVQSGGTSAIYGSDAVAGVVNIIYKKNFQGVEGNVQAGVSEKGDDHSRQANLTMGSNFADDKGNVMIFAGYARDGTVRSADRARSAIDQISIGGGITGDINDLFDVQRPFFSSFAPQGTYFFGDGSRRTLDANGNVIPVNTNGTGGAAPTGFNRSAFRYIAVPVERYLLAMRGNYEIAPEANVYIDGTFAKSHAESVLEPFPIATAGTNGIFQGNGGFFPIEQRLPDGTLFVNPYIPAGLVARTSDVDGDGLRDISFSRRLTDIGNRGSVADRTTYRIVTGIKGDFAEHWHYDLFFNYGRTDDNQTSSGQVNLASFRSALAVTQVAAGTAGGVLLPNGITIACADINARAQGCVPANIFGANTLSPAAAAYLRADSTRRAFAQQINTGLNVTGSLWDLWGAGPIGISGGAEYRKESGGTFYDALTQTGQNGGNALPNTSGSFDVVEGYGEARLPILTDKPFVKDLELRIAGRVAHYSTVGTVYTWNIGGEYAVNQDILFRVERARATRAPNIVELFQGPSQTFPTGIQDPCVGVTAASTGVLADTCRAAPGVNANIAANGSFTQTQSDVQGISGFDSGNPKLKSERGDTLTAGVVITPKSIDFLRNFSFTVDYARTKIKDAIVQTPRQFILNQCYVSGIQSFCQFITRRPTSTGVNSPGSIEFVNAGVTNSGGEQTSSIDVTANYRKSFDKWGKIDLNIAYTHLLTGYQIPLPGSDKDYFAGEVGSSKDRFTLNLNYQIAGVSFNYRGTYIGAAYLDDQFVLSLTEDNGDPVTNRHDPRARIGAKYYSDLQASVDVGDHFSFYAGVNNMFNVSPPPIYTGLPGDVTGSETDSGTYDAIGRRFYAGARLRF